MRDHIAEHDQAPASRGQHVPLTTVSDVVVRDPKTLSAAAAVHDAVVELQDDHVPVVLLVDGERLVGTMARADVPDGQSAVGARAVDFATPAGRTVRPDAAAPEVMASMRTVSIRRLAVVDGDGRLLGLLCPKRTGRGFCSDEDVASQRRAHSTRDE